MKRKLLYLLFFVSFFQISIAQNVSLDTSFGVGGKVVNSTITSGQAIQLQSDGKIVSCYLSDFSVFGNVHLTRFNVDGSIDTTFGDNGFVNSTLVNETGGINMMKIQSDDKIIITGFASSNGTGNSSYFDFQTLRLNSNGIIDSSFGVNGFATLNLQSVSDDTSQVVEIQNDGKILIGGSSRHINTTNYSPDFAIVRYTSDGLLDTSFATNGVFIYNFGTHSIPFSSGYSSDYIHSIRVNSNGKIVVGGNTSVNESLSEYSSFGFICLSQNGLLDESFGNNGQKVVDFGGEEYMYNMKLAENNAIIAAGTYQYYVGSNSFVKIAMVKLLEDGNYDPSFGSNGIVLTNRDLDSLRDATSDLILQPDGKIVCIGATLNNDLNNADFLIIRFNESGSIDSSFNGNGYGLIDFNNTNDYGYSILMQSDEKYVCAGAIDYSIGCLARYNLTNLSTTQFSKSQFYVSPNPFTTSINLTFSLPKNEILSIDLIDANGRLIQNLSNEKAFLSGNNSLNLDLPETLSKGIYFLKINNGFENNTIKIIK